MTLLRSSESFNDIVGEKIIKQLNDEEKEGLLYIYNAKNITKTEYAENFEFNDKKAQRHIAKFKKIGVIIFFFDRMISGHFSRQTVYILLFLSNIFGYIDSYLYKMSRYKKIIGGFFIVRTTIGTVCLRSLLQDIRRKK